MCLQKLIDALVYQHLIDKELLKTAQILKEERIKFYSEKDFEDLRASETLTVVISRYFQKAKDKHFDIKEKPLDNKTEYLYSYDNPENWKQGRCLVCENKQKETLKKRKGEVHGKKRLNARQQNDN